MTIPAFWFILASLSAILSAAAAIMQKRVLREMSALEFSFISSVAIMFLSLFVPFTTDVTALSQTMLFILIAKSLMGGAAFLLVMMSLERNPITSALPLLGMTPAVTALVGVVFLDEHLQGVEWAGIGMMMAGTIILERGSSGSVLGAWKQFFRSRTHLPIFGALVLFAVSSVIDRMLLAGYRVDPRVVMFYQHIVYMTLFAVMLIVRRRPIVTIMRQGATLAVPIVAIALITIAYRLAQLEATKLAPVALVLAVKRTSILYAALVGGRMFSEEGLPRKLAAAGLIVAAGFLMLRHLAG